MKNLISLIFLLIGTGCVMTPNGDFFSTPLSVEAEIGSSSDFGPRVHVGSSSAVTVWLHPNFYVYDAYPIAQRHCSRWGFYASPGANWSVSATSARYLDYTCVRRRPYLAAPHFRRNYYGNRYDNSRRRERPYFSRPSRGVITPKPIPRVQEPVRRRRGTFGRVFSTPPVNTRSTHVERGKPWEHNRKKRSILTPRVEKRTVIERGKPWEHNTSKNKPIIIRKRSTLGSLKPKMSKRKSYTPKSSASRRYPGLKKKNGPSRKGTLSL